MELRKLKFAYIVKGIVATTLILLAIAFAIALYQATDVGGASLLSHDFVDMYSPKPLQPFSNGRSLLAIPSTSSPSPTTCAWRKASTAASSRVPASSTCRSAASLYQPLPPATKATRA